MAKSPSPTNGNDSEPKAPATPPIVGRIGEMVLVRCSETQSVPALIVNDFAGQNAPGVVSLCVFMAEQFTQTSPVRYIASAQHETDAIPDSVLISEPYVWWRGMEESDRKLRKEESAV
jgi:hypothetical protein